MVEIFLILSDYGEAKGFFLYQIKHFLLKKKISTTWSCIHVDAIDSVLPQHSQSHMSDPP